MYSSLVSKLHVTKSFQYFLTALLSDFIVFRLEYFSFIFAKFASSSTAPRKIASSTFSFGSTFISSVIEKSSKFYYLNKRTNTQDILKNPYYMDFLIPLFRH